MHRYVGRSPIVGARETVFHSGAVEGLQRKDRKRRRRLQLCVSAAMLAALGGEVYAQQAVLPPVTVEGKVLHGMYSGAEVFLLIDQAVQHPPENLCQLPLPGEVLLFHDSSSSVANSKKPTSEICFVYNRGVVLRGPEGVPTHCSLFARVKGDWKYEWTDFRDACRKCRWEGPQTLRIERA